MSEKHRWVYPDVASNCGRFEELKSGHYTAWRDITRQKIEAIGEHALFNWMPLAGATGKLGPSCTYCDII